MPQKGNIQLDSSWKAAGDLPLTAVPKCRLSTDTEQAPSFGSFMAYLEVQVALEAPGSRHQDSLAPPSLQVNLET